VADHKKEETFKVIDRRHFTGEGDLRPEVVELERREEEAAAREAAAKKAANPPAKPAANAPNPTTKSGSNPTAKASAAAATEYDILGTDQRSAAKDNAGSGLISPGASGGPISSDSGETPIAGEQSHSSRSFQMLVDFLTRNAAAMLGGMADPQTGRPFVDLEGAREVIDMLDALREKTRGNLSKEDDQLLIEVLGSLKLTFMEISKAAAEAMAKKAKAK
jgi:Domain of unknown function (DUF1844)